MRKSKGITLIALVITIVVLIILAGVAIRLSLGENSIFNKAQTASDETIKQAATEKMNLKITNIQMEEYTQSQQLPTLQKLADKLCEDNEVQYVSLASQKTASLNKIVIGDEQNIFTKLKEYPYEFEINSSLQLASIDGIKIAATNTQTTNETYTDEEQAIGTWIDGKTIYRKIFTGTFGQGSNSETYKTIADISEYNVNEVINIYGKALVCNRTVFISIPAYYGGASYGYISAYYNISNKSICLNFGAQYNANTNNEYTIIIEYTKQ